MLRYPGCAAFLLLLLFPLILPAQEASPFPSARDHLRDRFSISGTVRDAAGSHGIAGVQVELRRLGGMTIASVNTGRAGNFLFNDIGPGEYTLVAQDLGYEVASANVLVNDSPAFGVDLNLQPLHGSRRGESAATVSARELSIPHKAHDAMQKGLQLLYQKSQSAKSLAEFQRAIRAYPDYYEAYAQMGVAYMSLGEPEKAEQALRTAITMSQGKYVDALDLLAMLDSNRKRFAEAEPLARQGTELDPQSWQSQYELARALYGLGRFAAAETCATAAAKLQPQNGPIRLELATIHSRLHNYPRVLDDFNAYLRIAPSGAQADRVRQVRDRLEQSLAEARSAAPSAPPPGKP
jgi:tetratricopeptide (TPR) repeat protein